MREEAARDVNANAVVLRNRFAVSGVRITISIGCPGVIQCGSDSLSRYRVRKTSRVGLMRFHAVPSARRRAAAVEVGVHGARRDPEPAFERAYYLQVIYEWRRRVDEHVSARLDRALIVRPETGVVVRVFNGVGWIERIRIR
jgi:hypothetical protein